MVSNIEHCEIIFTIFLTFDNLNTVVHYLSNNIFVIAYSSDNIHFLYININVVERPVELTLISFVTTALSKALEHLILNMHADIV